MGRKLLKSASSLALAWPYANAAMEALCSSPIVVVCQNWPITSFGKHRLHFGDLGFLILDDLFR
jgi:hypothetical protein